MQKKIQIKFLVSEIIASELAALNCVYYEGNTSHGQSMRQQTLLRLCISVTEFFCNPIAFRAINNYAKDGVVQISTALVPVHHAARRSLL